jgi:hypothetical protein
VRANELQHLERLVRVAARDDVAEVGDSERCELREGLDQDRRRVHAEALAAEADLDGGWAGGSRGEEGAEPETRGVGG